MGMGIVGMGICMGHGMHSLRVAGRRRQVASGGMAP